MHSAHVCALIFFYLSRTLASYVQMYLLSYPLPVKNSNFQIEVKYWKTVVTGTISNHYSYMNWVSWPIQETVFLKVWDWVQDAYHCVKFYFYQLLIQVLWNSYYSDILWVGHTGLELQWWNQVHLLVSWWKANSAFTKQYDFVMPLISYSQSCIDTLRKPLDLLSSLFLEETKQTTFLLLSKTWTDVFFLDA